MRQIEVCTYIITVTQSGRALECFGPTRGGCSRIVVSMPTRGNMGMLLWTKLHVLRPLALQDDWLSCEVTHKIR